MATRLTTLGPGIILAAAAVGASHLVAATQAGALFGWQLLGLVAFVNILKYPFFRFGVTYTLTHNESLVSGYYRKHKLYLGAFTLLNLIAAVVNTAGVLLLTASLLQIFLPKLSLTLLCWLVLLICLLVLLAGQYRTLDRISKWIMVSLSMATVIAVIVAWQNYTPPPADFVAPSPWRLSALAFLVAMMGWMPVPIELSVINSLWLRSKQKLTQVTLRDGIFDFNLGYWTTVILALLFLALGALVQYGSPQPIEMAGMKFADQFVAMYRATIGEWAGYLVGAIAVLCMFGTTLAVLDGYARTLAESFHTLTKRQYPLSGWVVGQAVAGMLVILYFQSALGPMLSFAMTLAFLTTPFFAWLNYTLVREQKLATGLHLWAGLGLLYLCSFTLLYLYWLLFL